MKRILVAYDGSYAARRALAHTAELVRPGDRVVVCNVMHEPGVGARIEPPTPERNQQWRLLDEARRFMAARGLEVETAASVGDTAAELLDRAERAAVDVIVIAHRRGRGLHVHGSVTERVVHGAHCDVLVVYAGELVTPRSASRR